MQFNTRDGPPSTWERYGSDANRDGTDNVYDPQDAIPSAAHYLRALLRAADGNLSQAIFGYNPLPRLRQRRTRARPRLPGTTDQQPAATVAVDVTAAAPTPASCQPARPTCAPHSASPHHAGFAPCRPGRSPAAGRARSTRASMTTPSGSYGATTCASAPPGRRATAPTATAPPSTSSPPTGTRRRSGTRSAGRLAHDLGWTPACARSGTRPACRLAPAIQFIGYDGYPGHGSPRTCTGRCPAHLHLSWASPCYGTSRLPHPANQSWRSPSRRPTTRPPRAPNPSNRRDRRHPHTAARVRRLARRASLAAALTVHVRARSVVA